ncbi:MAG TPA: RnfH family protein [Gammaproteobacteria bacterium]|nr:RnfH family protein [Gammaproteobacteria bacterium]
MTNTDTIPIEVVYALPREQVVITLDLPTDATVSQAIEESRMRERFPEIDLAANKVGIFGKAAKLDDGLHAGDRIEIYRPLIADPKEVRRQRAKEGKAMKAGS